MATTSRRGTHRRTTSAHSATTTHTIIVADILRALLAEVAQVVDELNGVVASDHVVPTVLGVT